MAKITSDHIKAFHDLIRKIPRFKRLALSTQLKLIQDLLNDSTDLINLDLRGAHWVDKAQQKLAEKRKLNGY